MSKDRLERGDLDSGPTGSRLGASLAYMLAHLNQPVKIARLSAMAGLSESRFFELFKDATGDTPLNWFIRARMNWAGELLTTSNGPIKEIAGRVGYEDPYYFSRLFKAVHGIPPRTYRLQKAAEKMETASSNSVPQ